MLKIIAIMAAVFMVTIACVSYVRAKEVNTTEQSQKARALVKSGSTLLDVRTPQEFASGHAEGAINIPVDGLNSRIRELPKGRSVVVYCQSGRRSGMASEMLKKAGFEVFDLQRFSNW